MVCLWNRRHFPLQRHSEMNEENLIKIFVHRGAVPSLWTLFYGIKFNNLKCTAVPWKISRRNWGFQTIGYVCILHLQQLLSVFPYLSLWWLACSMQGLQWRLWWRMVKYSFSPCMLYVLLAWFSLSPSALWLWCGEQTALICPTVHTMGAHFPLHSALLECCSEAQGPFPSSAQKHTHTRTTFAELSTEITWLSVSSEAEYR